MTTAFNGFNIDDTGRVVIEDLAAIVGTYIGMPVTAVGDCASSQTGAVVAASNRCGVTATGRVLYQDVAAVPYGGVIFSNGSLPFTQAGALLCDSAGPIASYNGGLPFTARGLLCIDGNTPIVPKTIVTESGNTLVTEAGDVLVT